MKDLYQSIILPLCLGLFRCSFTDSRAYKCIIVLLVVRQYMINALLASATGIIKDYIHSMCVRAKTILIYMVSLLCADADTAQLHVVHYA